MPPPNSRRHVLDCGAYEIEVAVTARNSDATTWVAEISFKEELTQGWAKPTDVKASIRRL